MHACFFMRTRDRSVFDVVEFFRNDIRILRDLGFSVTIATSLAEVPWNADLYYTWWWGPGILSLAKSLPARRPNVFTGALQLDPVVGWWQQLGTGRRMVVRSCLKLATANLAICDHELEYLHRLGARNPRRVYPAIDSKLYAPGGPPLSQREKLVVTVSHLTTENVRRKRVATFVRAVPHVLQRHPDARFVIVGAHQTGYEGLRRLAEDVGALDVIDFPGRISTQEKIALLHQARVLAQPTIYEGFGVSIAEAMATGLPVVTSPRGSIPEVVGDCGLMVEPDDDRGLAQHISDLLDDPERSARMGERGRARIVSLFAYEQRRDELRSVFESVLQPSRGARR